MDEAARKMPQGGDKGLPRGKDMAAGPNRAHGGLPPIARLGRASILFLLSALAFGFVILSIINNPLRINNDAALDLLVADRLLEGAAPYAGYMHINPPLIHYLMAIPVWMGRLFHLNPIVSFNVLVIGLTGLAIALAIRVLRDREHYQRAVI
ncbi:MAG: hypothetical protein ACRDHY_14140, partial [Anaerolineales bacterium]